MSHVRTRRRPQRNQTALFPDTLEGYVYRENPVRFIDAFVESLNLEKLGFKHFFPSDLCRPSYNPSDLYSNARQFIAKILKVTY
jgi:hypothetical protein